MSTNRIVVIVAFALIIIDLIWFAIRVVKNGFDDKNNWNGSFILREVLIYLCAIGIIVLNIFMEFGTLGDVVLCGCGVLAVEIANKELLPKPIDKD